MDRLQVLRSQRHHKVAQIFHHAAYNDVVLSKLGILKRIENDIVLVHRLRCHLAHIEEFSINVVNLNFIFGVIVAGVNVLLYQFHLFLVELIHICGLWYIVFFLEDTDILRFFLATSDKVAKVGELVVRVRWRLWKPVVTWVKHDITLLLVNYDF